MTPVDTPETPLRQRAKAIKQYRCKNLVAVLENPMDIRNIGTVIRNVNALGVEKTYIAKVAGSVTPAIIRELLAGFELEDGFIKADTARIMEARKESSLIEVVLHSGRNRIVRRMLDFVGHPVVGLVRKQFGPIQLGTLRSGAVRELTKLEIGALLKAADATDEPKRQRPRNK